MPWRKRAHVLSKSTFSRKSIFCLSNDTEFGGLFNSLVIKMNSSGSATSLDYMLRSQNTCGRIESINHTIERLRSEHTV